MRKTQLALLIVFVSLAVYLVFNISHNQTLVQKEIPKLNKKSSIEQQKIVLKQRINEIQNLIKITRESYKDQAVEQTQKKLLEMLHKVNYNNNIDEHIFIFKLYNINGGKGFAELLITRNSVVQTKKLINDDFKDSDGKMFFKEMLQQLRQSGSAFVQYNITKPSVSKSVPKISYFYLDKEWQWIIGTGKYLDDIK